MELEVVIINCGCVIPVCDRAVFAGSFPIHQRLIAGSAIDGVGNQLFGALIEEVQGIILGIDDIDP